MNTSSTGLASDFIKAQIRKNTELEEQIISSLPEVIEIKEKEIEYIILATSSFFTFIFFIMFIL